MLAQVALLVALMIALSLLMGAAKDPRDLD
jgi:hypothetical protein